MNGSIDVYERYLKMILYFTLLKLVCEVVYELLECGEKKFIIYKQLYSNKKRRKKHEVLLM